METEQLKQLLHTMHDELAKNPNLDQESRQLLEDIAKDILDMVDKEGAPAQHADLVDRLQGSIAEFEVSHPDLVTIISKILEGLSNAGI